MVDLSTGKIIRKRFVGGKYVDGHWVEGKKECIEVDASVQPMNPNEMKMLPEARRNFEVIKFYSETDFKTSDEKKRINADIVEYKGKDYEVWKVWDYSIETCDPHFKVFAIQFDGEGA